MPLTLASPFNFSERLLLFGGPGSGKTTAVLEVARHTPESVEFHVLDNDESYSYDRALETDFTDVAHRVHVTQVAPDWESMAKGLAHVTSAADHAKRDFVVVDSISPAWDFVQAYMTEVVVGVDVASHLAQLRKDADDLKDFHAAIVDSVPWQIIKKEYSRHITLPIRNWTGNLILTAEAKQLGKKDDDQIKTWFSQVGMKPAGEGRLAYIPATVLYFEHNAKLDKYKMTTIKDRNRGKVEHQVFENFAIDYLLGVGGWQRQRKDQSS